MVPGVRGRLVAALVLVALATVGLTAVTLLGPLNARLRADRIETLTAAARAAVPTVGPLAHRSTLATDPHLAAILRHVRSRSGADVAAVDRAGHVVASTDVDGEADPNAAELGTQGAAALRRERLTRTVLGSDQGPEAVTAVPIAHATLALVLHRPLNDTNRVAHVVQAAYVPAAALSLVVAVILGQFVARGLARRVRLLRDTALQVADIGPVAKMTPDARRDELGDLSRAFARMQERLREQEQARRTFVSTGSHELRTPLSSLRFMLEMLREDLDAEPPDVVDARLQAARAESQADKLTRLAGDLLDLSRLDAGLVLREEPVELDAVARSVTAEFESRLAAGRRGLQVNADGGHWAVGDFGAAAQVVRILVDNALRHAPPGTTVRVAVDRENGAAAVRVEDDGPGVAPVQRNRIFERFERGSDAVSPGFGLGLAIGRELARRMDGDLVLDAERSGGSFVLRLPSTAGPGDAGSAS